MILDCALATSVALFALGLLRIESIDSNATFDALNCDSGEPTVVVILPNTQSDTDFLNDSTALELNVIWLSYAFNAFVVILTASCMVVTPSTVSEYASVIP